VKRTRARLTWQRGRSTRAARLVHLGAATCLLASLGACRRAERVPERTVEAGTPAKVQTPSPDTVAGVVVRTDGPPMPGILVASAGAQVTTDEHGRFALSGLGRDYSLTLVDAERARVTIYQGLTRRDPILVFADAADARQYEHHATLAGTLSGGGPYPVTEEVTVHFASRYAQADFPLASSALPHERGPRFGPMHIAWNGPERIGGELFVLRTPRGQASVAAWVRLPLELLAREARELEVALSPVALVQRPVSRVETPPGVRGTLELSEHYRLPGVGVLFPVAGSLTGPHAEADLRKEGLPICAAASLLNPLYRGRDERCDFPPDKPAELLLLLPPALSSPTYGTPASVGLSFGWSPMPDAVYQLTLAPSRPSPATPELRVLTSQLSTTWPDLESVGVHFPKPVAAYSARLAALGPYEDLDQAAGPDGLAATRPRRAWSSEAAPVSVPVAHPLGKAEAACRVPLAAKLSCPTVTGKPATYSLSALNHKLRHYPELAAASGVHCVRDCSAALDYARAYAVYSQEHPGFDADEPPLAPPVGFPTDEAQVFGGPPQRE
jgi:hypothetical protein